ncbi:exosortase-associated protein EpsI, B-type [Pseudoduganella violacea]|uniref:EpsI family protein n=1 Tax=Pseudoduganella violacea TaxID=1715466 RepID=A0A7W5BB92_9BURK|nr:exosortase-associated protein EpsI, B-type [Pseudoduganella violacea]MBB3119605.1 EpsI family protein [Pseudoduganella violacea]
MNRSILISCILGGALVLSSAGARYLTPTVKVADGRPPVVLEQAIPSRFGDWEEDKHQIGAVVNPTTQAEIDRIYAQTLARTYVNRKGERIMLSIAYGTDQSDNLSVHFPEGCYGGQGFAVGPTVRGTLQTGAGTVPVARLTASLNGRIEPITYWVVVGEQSVDSSWQLKKAKLAYALKGLIPDATLMRVSSISADSERAFALQQQFVNDLLAAQPPAARRHFAGLGQ